MKKAIPLLALVLILTSQSSGFGYIETREAGSPLPGFSAMGLSLGGVRSFGLGDGSSSLTNPAGLCRVDGPLISLSIGPGIGSELVLDSLGRHESNWLSFSNLSGFVAYPIGRDLTLGLATARINDYSFQFVHYTYDFGAGQSSYLTEVRDLKVTGGMYESVGALSYSVADWLNLGFSAGLRYGSANFDSSYTDMEDPDNDTLVTWEREFDSFCWHGGVEIPMGEGLLGFSWASEDDDYPARAAMGGFLYLNEKDTDLLGADVEIGDPGGRNSTLVRVFGIYFPSERFEMRAAFSFATPNYDNIETGTSMGLSLGTGIGLGSSIKLDAGVSWNSLARDTLLLVPGEPDEIKDSSALISFGFSWIP